MFSKASNFEKKNRFMVTLFDLGLTLTAPFGNTTTGLFVTDGEMQGFPMT